MGGRASSRAVEVRVAGIRSCKRICDLDSRLIYLQYVDMITAKIFRHGGSQAVRLPKAFRFDGNEVLIEKHGDEVVLKPLPLPKLRSFTEIARYLAEMFPGEGGFPKPPPRPKTHERPIIEF